MDSRMMGAAPAIGGGQGGDLWAGVAGRVTDYLRALGIEDQLHLERLAARIRQRLETRAAAVPLEDPLEAAIEEAYGALDAWLCAELGIEGDRSALFTARAAVLSGAVPHWAARFAGVSGESRAAAIQAAVVQALPPDAPLAMVPNTIDLFWRRVGHAIAAALRHLLGMLPADAAAAASHQGRPQ
ncbi:hypothetical protein [uncultured Thiodictyon sp.]|uniref:hypothetical protein n=1 Tax=uncultured Thiodictyon sp. TaxID=1846217 RepID=UPI0025E1CE48|nr:hypothetical protein [uncultured Thiodictyon sp.]